MSAPTKAAMDAAQEIEFAVREANDFEVIAAAEIIDKHMPISSVWNPGPARGGEGTAGMRGDDSWWSDGELLLIIVETASGPVTSLVRVSADGPESLSFLNPDTGDDDFGYSSRDIEWWSRISPPGQSVDEWVDQKSTLGFGKEDA